MHCIQFCTGRQVPLFQEPFQQLLLNGAGSHCRIRELGLQPAISISARDFRVHRLTTFHPQGMQVSSILRRLTGVHLCLHTPSEQVQRVPMNLRNDRGELRQKLLMLENSGTELEQQLLVLAQRT